jgi:hypothetical protein
MKLKIRYIFLTFLLVYFVGTFLAVVPISMTYASIDMRRFDIAHLNVTGAILTWLTQFFDSTVSAYFFGLILGLPATLTVATCLSIVGVMKKRLPLFAAVVAFVSSLSLGLVLEWDQLLCQCHRNLAGKVHLMPLVYLCSYVLLAFGSWYILRPVCRKSFGS